MHTLCTPYPEHATVSADEAEGVARGGGGGKGGRDGMSARARAGTWFFEDIFY
jgi:hypothetical protein